MMLRRSEAKRRKGLSNVGSLKCLSADLIVCVQGFLSIKEQLLQFRPLCQSFAVVPVVTTRLEPREQTRNDTRLSLCNLVRRQRLTAIVDPFGCDSLCSNKYGKLMQANQTWLQELHLPGGQLCCRALSRFASDATFPSLRCFGHHDCWEPRSCLLSANQSPLEQLEFSPAEDNCRVSWPSTASASTLLREIEISNCHKRELLSLLCGLRPQTLRVQLRQPLTEDEVAEIFGPWLENLVLDALCKLDASVILKHASGLRTCSFPREIFLLPPFPDFSKLLCEFSVRHLRPGMVEALPVSLERLFLMNHHLTQEIAESFSNVLALEIWNSERYELLARFAQLQDLRVNFCVDFMELAPHLPSSLVKFRFGGPRLKMLSKEFAAFRFCPQGVRALEVKRGLTPTQVQQVLTMLPDLEKARFRLRGTHVPSNCRLVSKSPYRVVELVK